MSESPKREALRERARFIYPQSEIPECPGYREVRGASSALRQHSGFLCLEGNMSEIPKGFCQCGCNQLTLIIKKTNKELGLVKGEPRKFLVGHSLKVVKGDKHPGWKGGKIERKDGACTRFPGHPRAQNNYVYDHILKAEKALGKPLPLKAVVHHHTPEQLVVCQDQSYHLFLHRRKRAYEACGHADWRKCVHCKNYDDPVKLTFPKKGQPFHRECVNAYNRKYQNQKKDLLDKIKEV